MEITVNLISADRVIVQCHLDEVDLDAVPEWYILYRRSASKLQSTDLTEDVVQRSRYENKSRICRC